MNSLRKKSEIVTEIVKISVDNETQTVLDLEDHHKAKEPKVTNRYLSQDKATESQTTRLASLHTEETHLKQLQRHLAKDSMKKRPNMLKDLKVILKLFWEIVFSKSLF